MKAILPPFIAAIFMSLNLYAQTTLFEENFDSYLTGIGVASQTTSWQTWSYTTGASEDARVSGEHYSSGDKSLNITNDNDILYNFGSRVSGSYSIEFKMYVKQGKGAYLNVEHGNRSKYAFQLFFTENNQLWFDNGDDSVQLASYNSDEWFTFRLFTDLENDTLMLYQNDVVIGGFDFSTTMNSSQPMAVLGYLDFYGVNDYPAVGIYNTDFFIDDFKFVAVSNPEPITGCDQLNYYATSAQAYGGYYVDLETSGFAISTSGNYDDANSGPVDIGFTFNFNCQDFTQFILNTNGFIKLGNTPPSSPALFFDETNTISGGIFSSNHPADVNLISPFNHDLTAGTGTPEYRVFTEGTEPYRICTIQFKNMSDKTGNPARQFDNMNFQIRLYETMNIIEFVYGEFVPSGNTSALKTAACGLKGSTFSDEDLLVVSKASNAGWNYVSFINANYSVNAFNFGNPPERPVPEWAMTYRFVPALQHDLAVNEIYMLGTTSFLYGNPQVLSASIGNKGINILSDAEVVLNVEGVSTFRDTVIIPFIHPKTNVTVTFKPFSSTSAGFNLAEVSVPEDDGFDNNLRYGNQFVTEAQARYAFDDYQEIDWGYAANQGGILLAKYHISGTTRVMSVDAFLVNYGSIGMTVYALTMDKNGTITGQSDEFIIQEEDLNSWHSFNLNGTPLLTDTSFYAGLAIPPAEIAYYPLGVQIENPCRSDAYFWSPIGGGSLNNSYRRFMIGVTLNSPTGIEEHNSPENAVLVFPNPAESLLTVAGLTETVLAEVFSSNGVLLRTCILNPVKDVLNIRDLSAGIYIIRLTGKNEFVVRKFIRK
jgi:hypothetical protein